MADEDARAQPAVAFPRRVAVVGAAGGLGSAIIEACREERISFTAIVRSRPDRIAVVPEGSRVVVVPTLADRAALSGAFRDADAVLSAVGVTATSQDPSALLSENMDTVEAAMASAGVDRIVLINTVMAAAPGEPANWPMRLFRWLPGPMGRGARELQAVVDAVGLGALARVRWTLVRAAVNARGRDAPPIAGALWRDDAHSMAPVSYRAMARWMLEEAVADRFVGAAPFVTRRK